jgi:hypothetical protein
MLLMPNVMNQVPWKLLKVNEYNPLQGENLLLKYIQFTRQYMMILRLGLHGIYIGYNGYPYNKMVKWNVRVNLLILKIK